MLYWFWKWTKSNMWSGALNKRKLTSEISNRFLPSSVGRAGDWWSGGHGFKPHWGQFLTKLKVLFVGPLIPLFWTSGDVCPGFQSQSGSLACFLACVILRFTSGMTPAKVSMAADPRTYRRVRKQWCVCVIILFYTNNGWLLPLIA